jgi:hypothetical protein
VQGECQVLKHRIDSWDILPEGAGFSIVRLELWCHFVCWDAYPAGRLIAVQEVPVSPTLTFVFFC